ncbi:MAG: tetratricopeptide repeat protein [Deltaproteobacteria bacterium]|nr:tetratricopeptide repeat protein [Deltaproteobacteria bacterium]
MRRSLPVLYLILMMFSTPFLCGFSLTKDAEEKSEFIESLMQDIVKVDHSIGVTKELIRRSKNASFLPDIIFRLAELYVEKSRLVYYLEVETKGADQAVSSPEAKLLKNEAITIYRDVMHRFPEYRYNDKVLFFMAHEFHELGMHDDMLDAYKKLVDDYPKSPLVLESLYIIGDYYFNRDQLDDAEKYYKKILEYRESPIHDMARYKLGWISINKARTDKKYWRIAIKLFESVVLSKNTTDKGIKVDTNKMVNIKLEALNGVVFCYTEVYKPKRALEYFEKLASSKQLYMHALSKLANRYFIKEQFDNAALIYRRIIALSNDVEKNLDYAQRIYDASSFSKRKDKVDEDVKAIVKAAENYTYSWRIPEEEKKQLAKEFEVYARDIVTKLHMLAKKRNEKRAFRIAARAYKEYLDFFDYSPKFIEMKFNYAEALFDSKQYLKAGEAYEDVARLKKESKERKDALYSAIQSYQYALGDLKYLTRFEVVQARQGLKQLGAYFVKKYPKDPKTPTIKFNVARMYYDQGKYKQAIESFLEFIKQYPTAKEVTIAGNLVLDCYKQLEDYKGLAKQAKAFAANQNIKDEKFKHDVLAIADQAEERQLDKASLQVAAEGGNALEKLIEIADSGDSALSEKALYRSFVMAKEKRNIQMAFKAGAQLAAKFKKSKHLPDVYATLGNFSAQTADFERSASLYEDFFSHFPNMPEAREAMFAAATFHTYLGQYREAIKDYRKLLEKETGQRKGEILISITEAYANMEDWRMVITMAKKALAEISDSVKAHLLLAKALEKRGKIAKAKEAYMMAASVGGGSPQETHLAAEAQFRLGDIMFSEYKDIKFGAGEADDVIFQKKMQKLGQVEQFYAGVVQMKDPEWAIASLYRLSKLYEDFASFLKKAPIPKDLKGAQKKQYKQMLANQVKEQSMTAKTYLSTCVKTVRQKKVFGPFALACIRNEPPVEQVVRRRSAGRANVSRVTDFKNKLLKNPADLEAMDKLAMASIESGDYYMAKLVLSRALETRESHAPSLNLMGVVSLYMGDDQDGYNYFKKALESDVQLLPARMNLAALFVKYQDLTRARATVKMIRARLKTADLSTPDFHPIVRDAVETLKLR